MGLTNWNKQKEKSNRWWTQGYSFGIRKVGEVSMVIFIFLFVLFMVLVLSVNSYWDGTNCVRSASGLSQTFALEIVYLNEL